MKLKAIIIEDETRAQIYLKGIIEQVAPEIEVVDVCDDLPSGVISIRKYQPDIVFLDIEMPKYSGLEITQFFSPDEINFAIIFVTAYNQYAIQAFKTSALDYLLKPVDPDELKETIQRLKKNHKIHHVIQEVSTQLKGETKIAIPNGNALTLIVPSEIVYLKADNTYTKIIMKDGQRYMTSRLLKNFEESLTTFPQFMRCHKSYIINTDFIVSYTKSNGGMVELVNQCEIPVSLDKVEELLNRFIRVVR